MGIMRTKQIMIQMNHFLSILLRRKLKTEGKIKNKEVGSKSGDDNTLKLNSDYMDSDEVSYEDFAASLKSIALPKDQRIPCQSYVSKIWRIKFQRI